MTTEEIKQIALEKYGKNLTDQQAAEYAERYGKMSDDELENVSGGGCTPTPSKPCPNCNSTDLYYIGQPGGKNQFQCGECWKSFYE